MSHQALPIALLDTPVCLSRCKKKAPLPDPSSDIHVQVSTQLRSLIWTHLTETLSDICLNPAAAAPARVVDAFILSVLDMGVPPSKLAEELRGPTSIHAIRTDVDRDLAVLTPVEDFRGMTVGQAMIITAFAGGVSNIVVHIAAGLWQAAGGRSSCLHDLLSERGLAILADVETQCADYRKQCRPPPPKPDDRGTLIDEIRTRVSRKTYTGAEWKKSSVWRTQVREAGQVYAEVFRAVHRTVWSEGIDVLPFRDFILEICPIVQLLALTIEDVTHDPKVGGRLAPSSPTTALLSQCARFCVVAGATGAFIRRRDEEKERIANLKAEKEAAKGAAARATTSAAARAMTPTASTSTASTSTIPLASTSTSTSIPSPTSTPVPTHPPAPPKPVSAATSKPEVASKAPAPASKGAASTSEAPASTSQSAAALKDDARSKSVYPPKGSGTTFSESLVPTPVPKPRDSSARPVIADFHPHQSRFYQNLPRVVPPMTCPPHIHTGKQIDYGALAELDAALGALFHAQFVTEAADQLDLLVYKMRDRALDQLFIGLDGLGSLDVRRTDVQTRIAVAVQRGLEEKVTSIAMQASIGHYALVKSLQDSVVLLDELGSGSAARATCVCELSLVADNISDRAMVMHDHAVVRNRDRIEIGAIEVTQWIERCAERKRNGSLKAPCWSGRKGHDDLERVIGMFGRLWDAKLQELTTVTITALWANTLSWISGLRVYEEAVQLGSIDYSFHFTDNYSIAGGAIANTAPLKHWADLLKAAAKAVTEGRPITLEDAARWKEEGDQLFEKGHLVAAIVKYSTAITANPLDISARTNRALARLKLGSKSELQAVVSECSSTLDYSHENVKAWFRRGVALSRLKMYDTAILDLEEVIQLDPENFAAQEELAIARAGAAGPK